MLKIALILFSLLSISAYAADKPALTEMQKYVTQQGGTEKPFDNEYWNNHAEGIYVDVVSGEALFSSTDKYDSGTGWPSFTQPIDQNFVETKTDKSLGMNRTEVKSKSGSHLGHIFDDGPKDKGGKRYCINSAALRFVPKADLEKEGYGKYLKLFPNTKANPSNDKKVEANTPKLIALYFYADWCGNCKLLSPKFTEARIKGNLDNKGILFVKLDLTDKTTIHQALMLAHALDVNEFVKAQGSATGYVAILDATSKKELTRFDKTNSSEEILDRMTKQLK